MSTSWLSLEDALIKARATAHAVSDVEYVSLSKAHRRVVVEDIIASTNVPPWDNSSMDGYAIHVTAESSSLANDNTKATDSSGKTFTVQGVITAGDRATTPLHSEHAYKIMTGAPIPQGANAVVMVENTSSSDANTVTVHTLPTAGENIRVKANDIASGEVLIKKGTLLRAEHLMLLSSQGLNTLPVYRKLRVGIVATGNELAAPGEACSDTQIFESNRAGISAIVEDENVEIIDFGIVKDDKASLSDLFHQASNTVDIMISSGGVSVGDADYVKDVIDSMGSIEFWKIAVKPGKPFALGKLDDTVFCGLPGNPVSSFVTAKLLVLPIIRKMQGRQDDLGLFTVTATLTKDIKRRPGRRDFQRALMSTDTQGNLVVTPLKNQSSGVMTSITSANCFMIVHEELAELNKGDAIPVIPFT